MHARFLKRFVFLILVITTLGVGPCSRLRGTDLVGEVVPGQVADWTFIETLGLCQLEVRPERPYSITAYCIESQKALYVGCMRCPGKVWPELAIGNPSARVQFKDKIYMVDVERVTDEALRNRVWADRFARRGPGEPSPTPEHWWLFSLASRQP